MARVRGLYVDIALGVAKLQKDVDRVNTSLRSIKGSTDLVSRQLNTMKNAALGAVAGFLSFQAAKSAIISFKGAMEDAIDTASKIADVADKVGFTTDQLQELRYAAQQNGVEQRTLDMALQRFSRRIGEVSNGQGELLKTAQQYNIAVRDSDGIMRSNVDILKDFANVIQNAGSEQEQLRIAFKLFDSEGAALVNLMRQGADGVQEFRNRAKSLGIVMDEALIRRAKDSGDELATLSQVIDVQFKNALLNVAPDLIKLAQELLPAVTAGINQFASALKLFTEEGKVDRRLGEIADKIQLLKKNIDILSSDSAAQRVSNALNSMFGHDVQDRIKELQDQIKALEDEREALLKPIRAEAAENRVEPVVANKLSDENREFLRQWQADFEAAQIAQGQQIIADRANKQFAAYMAVDAGIQQFKEQLTRDNEQRLLDIQERAAQESIRIERYKANARMALASATSQFLGAAASAVEEKNFELAKKFRAAQIVIDTASAVMRTYAEYGGTPVGIAAAAFVAGAGAIQLATVLSAKPGSSQIAGTGAAPPTAPAVSPPPAQTTTTTTEIHFHGPVYGDRDAMARDLVPAIEQAQSDGARR